MATSSINNIANASSQWADSLLGRLGAIPASLWRQVAIAGLLLWLCFALAKLFWLLFPAPSLTAPGLDTPRNLIQISSSGSELAAVDIDGLSSMKLFGSASAATAVEVAQAPAEDIGPDLDETNLKLLLRGTMASSVEQQSQATIGEGSSEKTYRIGDELEISTRGVKLAKVEVDHVVINNNGKFEMLAIHSFGDEPRRRSTASRSSTQTVRQPNARPRAPIAPPTNLGGVAPGLAPDEGQQEPTQAQLKAVSDLISVSMHREGGKLLGYKIRPKRDPALFEELGLQPNDVVTAVNGVTLEDTSKAMEVYRSLNQSSEATLEILRGGVTTTVQVSL